MLMSAAAERATPTLQIASGRPSAQQTAMKQRAATNGIATAARSSDVCQRRRTARSGRSRMDVTSAVGSFPTPIRGSGPTPLAANPFAAARETVFTGVRPGVRLQESLVEARSAFVLPPLQGKVVLARQTGSRVTAAARIHRGLPLSRHLSIASRGRVLAPPLHVPNELLVWQLPASRNTFSPHPGSPISVT
jgi:hypothetical protein